MAKKKRLLLFGKKRAEQRAAYQEVVEEIKQNPIGGYGLYHLMYDAGLISKDAEEKLGPIIASIEERLCLSDEELVITLPMLFEPITDIEHDTLTSVIGQALLAFAHDIAQIEEPLRLAELFGITNILKRHLVHTASMAYEVGLDQILSPLLQHCGTRLPFYRPDRLINAQPGDFFHVTELRRSKQKFASEFLKERNIQEGEVVQVEEVWGRGYLRVRRLAYTSSYSRAWVFDYLRQTLPQDNHLTVVNKDEGTLYRLNKKYVAPVLDFIDLYQAHLEDHSEDPSTYRPIGLRKM